MTSTRAPLPTDEDARLVLGAVAGAFRDGGGYDELQASVASAIASEVYALDVEHEPIEPLTADQVLALDPPFELRRHAVRLMAVLELVAHPLRREAQTGVRLYAQRLGVDLAVLHAARQLAHRHSALMYADLQRSSWYTKQTVKGLLHGKFCELVDSKLAYTGITSDLAISTKWMGLKACPDGSWGRGVADFYERHGFPFPGTHHGIYEIGAKHDFVHVLADYETDPEGEIDVFAFIAASMPDDAGLVLLAVTLGLFQNGSIHRVAGKEVKIARADTLSDPGAVVRFADAWRRGAATTTDVMGGIDQFAYADVPLDEVRERFNVLP
jgi:hypothetical protein